MKKVKLFESFLEESKKEEIKKSNKNIPFAAKMVKENETADVEEVDGVAVAKLNFVEFKKEFANKEGIVMLGCGGPALEWINGVTSTLVDEGIAKGTVKELWSNIAILKTSGGRTDIALVFNEKGDINMGKLAMWRLRFGDCSWISDYLVNYESQHIGGE